MSACHASLSVVTLVHMIVTVSASHHDQDKGLTLTLTLKDMWSRNLQAGKETRFLVGSPGFLPYDIFAQSSVAHSELWIELS